MLAAEVAASAASARRQVMQFQCSFLKVCIPRPLMSTQDTERGIRIVSGALLESFALILPNWYGGRTSVEYAARRPSVQRTDLETTGSLCLRCPPAATDAHGRPPGAGGGAEEGGCALCKPSQGSVDRPALLTVSGRGLGKRRCQAVPQRFPKAHVCFPRTKHRPALAADSWGM